MNGAYLDHIGIAVLPGSPLAKCLTVLGLSITSSEEVAAEKVAVDWIPLPQKPCKLELLHASDPQSAVAKYLDRHKRDGVHHLSFRVDAVAATSAALQAAGFQMVYDTARPGAHSCLVNFVHPSTTGGVLVEITEKARGH